MKIFSLIIFSSILCLSSFGEASRLPEIENHYSEKVSDLLKMRFPTTPYTVFVQIDAGDKNKTFSRKREIKRGGTQIIQLPYLEIEDEDLTVWERTDIPMSTLIGLLDRVLIHVQIDSETTDSELKELQDNIAKQLKLDPTADSIEIAKVDFRAQERTKQKIWIVLGFLLISGALFAIFWFLSKISVKQLVRGLAQPISEIGKSTQEFANSALNLAADINQAPMVQNQMDGLHKEEDSYSHGSNLLEIRKSALELIERNLEVFKNPDSRLLDFLETQGAENPSQVGAILAELEPDLIKNLYKYGWGDWWYPALAAPSPLTPQALSILNEIDRLRVRWTFSGTQAQPKFKETELIFTRLSDDQLVQVFQGVSISDAEPILNGLPKSKSLSTSKKLYPGQWAQLLEKDRAPSQINQILLEKLKNKALENYPLRDEKQIQDFFSDLDIVKFLDMASPRDERDFYTVLPQDSKIKVTRTPFYQIFDASLDIKKMMAGDIHAKDWAYALASCEVIDQHSILEGFPERLQFMIKEEMLKLNPSRLDAKKLRSIRRFIVQSYMRHSTRETSYEQTSQVA